MTPLQVLEPVCCATDCGAPLRLHFASGVIGRGKFLTCAIARYLADREIHGAQSVASAQQPSSQSSGEAR